MEQLKSYGVRRDVLVTKRQERQLQRAADIFGIEWGRGQIHNGAHSCKDKEDVLHVLDIRIVKARAEEMAFGKPSADALAAQPAKGNQP